MLHNLTKLKANKKTTEVVFKFVSKIWFKTVYEIPKISSNVLNSSESNNA